MSWMLVLLLVLICLPGFLVAVPRIMVFLRPTMEKNLKPGRSMPSDRTAIVAGTVQGMVLAAIAVVVGALLAPRVGLSAPFFEAVAGGQWSSAWTSLLDQLRAALVVGVTGIAVFLFAYYAVLRPRMDRESAVMAERMRVALGIAGRVLYGGIHEEVLTRWGLMTLFVWLASLAIGVDDAAFWIGILVSGVLFAIGHFPVSIAMGVKKTPWNIATGLFLNTWAGVVFGWLFWHSGLLAAMLAHSLFHLVWSPLEKLTLAAERARGDG